MQIHGISGWRAPKITNRPVPPVSAYDDWLKSRNRAMYRGPHYKGVTGQKIRRVVIMRRQGENWVECGRAVGHSGECVKGWVEFLPLDLQP